MRQRRNARRQDQLFTAPLSRVELTRTANTLRCSADEARRIEGQVLDSDAYPPERGRWGIVHRRPLGIVLAITPFNFPINLAAHKLGPAFAAGCPVLFKPGPANVLSGRRLTELAHAAGVPEETLQCCVPATRVRIPLGSPSSRTPFEP
jgi:acyl-CoA reductase-like NAD-dependent aldehyde dehydrogenase